MASRYALVFFQDHRAGFNLSNWEQEYVAYLGTLAMPLQPLEVRPIRLVIDTGRKVKGKVFSPEDKPLGDLRVQVWFREFPVPGLTDTYGYTVTHTRADGTFEADSVGPGPYRITVGDRKDRVSYVEGVTDEAAGDVRIVYRGEYGKEKL